MDFGGTSDPYCVVSGFGTGEIVRTPTIYKELNPFWGSEWSFDVATFAQKLQVIVFDENKKKDAPIGKVVVAFEALRNGELREQWYPLMPVSTKDMDFVSGVVELELLKTHSTLSVKLVRARGLASKDSNGLSDPYVKILFADAEYKTETKFKTLDPEFHDTFQFGLPSPAFYSKTLILTFWDYDKLSSDDFMGSIEINLEDLEFSRPLTHWFDLSPINHAAQKKKGGGSSSGSGAHKDLGSVRLKLKYTTEVILDPVRYDSLFNFLDQPGLPDIQAIGKVTREREPLAKALVAAFAGMGKAIWMLRELNAAEIAATETSNIIFRGNSLASKTNDMYLQLLGGEYLRSVIQGHIEHIYASPLDFEVDPTRVDDPAVLPTHWANLTALVEDIVESVLESAPKLPSPFKHVFAHLVEAVKAQFPGDDIVPYTVVSAFLFLRIICPAILGPKLFGLMPDHPQPRQSRTLTLVAKTLQNLANLVHFGPKEPFMSPMNAIIDSFLDDMREFLTAVSTPDPAELNQPLHLVEHAAAPSNLDWPRDMAKVHNHFNAALPALEEHADEFPDLSLNELKKVLRGIDTAVLNEIAKMPPDEQHDAMVSLNLQPREANGADDDVGEDCANERELQRSVVGVEHMGAIEAVELSGAYEVEDELAALEAELMGGSVSADAVTAASAVTAAGGGSGGGAGPTAAPIDTTVDDVDRLDESNMMMWNEVVGAPSTASFGDVGGAAAGAGAAAGGEPRAGAPAAAATLAATTVAERQALPIYSTAMMEELARRLLATQAATGPVKATTYEQLMVQPSGGTAGSSSGSSSGRRPSGASLFGRASDASVSTAREVDDDGFEVPKVAVQTQVSTKTSFGMPEFEGMDAELETLVEEMKTKLRVENKIVSKMYPAAFAGSEAVDFILLLTKGHDREPARAIGQQLLDRKVFKAIDVMGPGASGTFVDGYAFYQLTTKRDASMPVGLLNLIDQFKLNVPRKPKETRQTYKDVFLGFDLVSFIVTVICKMNPVRGHAVKVAQELFARNIIAALDGSDSFEDGYTHYYIVENPVPDPNRVENVLDTCGEVVYYQPDVESLSTRDKLDQAVEALTAWANLELRASESGAAISGPVGDALRDGTLLNHLLTVISPHYSALHVLKDQPKSRADELDNIMLVLRFLQDQGLGLGDFLDPTVPSMYSATALSLNEGNVMTAAVILHAMRRLVL
ncbi:Ras GTPase-activating protein 3 [Thecamonas trahens ATCC 50062]|uniref:Ras GTPase-activating protein 3 n=1 Tax=Thecamonas trahens ATCC 50062 TaxID=461836 RepID=A0A0L0D3B4_THETB|nr:Ras GTPase-activating protein 3 [Thecamonas trahens ATCC 50062]KNC46799.1 Ras GTPase-activating protein 3 [Thecamonas trahens ATCC 50062]|eukprot:XP_013760074.1 Ras GTPase-activating protein 3 [Thecamonas trahens ATCC 50062]